MKFDFYFPAKKLLVVRVRGRLDQDARRNQEKFGSIGWACCTSRLGTRWSLASKAGSGSKGRTPAAGPPDPGLRPGPASRG